MRAQIFEQLQSHVVSILHFEFSAIPHIVKEEQASVKMNTLMSPSASRQLGWTLTRWKIDGRTPGPDASATCSLSGCCFQSSDFELLNDGRRSSFAYPALYASTRKCSKRLGQELLFHLAALITSGWIRW